MAISRQISDENPSCSISRQNKTVCTRAKGGFVAVKFYNRQSACGRNFRTKYPPIVTDLVRNADLKVSNISHSLTVVTALSTRKKIKRQAGAMPLHFI
jgi:hypothetical protein